MNQQRRIVCRAVVALVAMLFLRPLEAQLRNCFLAASTPSAMDDWVTWPGGDVVIDVLGNDYDDDGDRLVITSFS